MKLFLPLLALCWSTVSALADPAAARKIVRDFGLTVDDASSFSYQLYLADEVGKPIDPRPLKDDARAIAVLLLGRDSYAPDLIKLCVFHADAILEIKNRKDGRKLEVAICFGCSQIIVSAGEESAEADFDRGRNGLLAIFKKAFPDNARAGELQFYASTYSVQDALDFAEMFIPEDPLLVKLKKLPLDEVTEDDADRLCGLAHVERERMNRRDAVDRAENAIPNDPLFKKLKAMPVDEISEEDLQVLGFRTSCQDDLNRAEKLIPDDPLLVKLKAAPLDDVSFKDLSVLSERYIQAIEQRREALARAKKTIAEDSLFKKLDDMGWEKISPQELHALQEKIEQAEKVSR